MYRIGSVLGRCHTIPTIPTRSFIPLAHCQEQIRNMMALLNR